MTWIDNFGRTHDDLRVSVTDRCNLRCAYCMPEEPVWFDRADLLSYEELARVVRVAVARGVRKVRLTGGEPLVRTDLVQFVAMLRRQHANLDLTLTTNGVLLAPLAEALAKAGLTRLNVSLDTLRPERFEQMTRRNRLDRVLEGLDAAAAVGMKPVKINTVILRGTNDDEVLELAERARNAGWELRFIEFMPLENGSVWNRNGVVSGEEIRERIGREWPIEIDPAGDPHAPAVRYRYADGQGTLGFIDSISAPFCVSCSRIRLTSDGKFRVCLYDDRETDLRGPLREGATDEALSTLMEQAILRKGRGGALEVLERQAALPLRRTMHQIGG